MHVEHEGPGTLGTFLQEEGVETKTLHLYGGNECPAHPEETDLIVSMGGPMNVYEDRKYPFLARGGKPHLDGREGRHPRGGNLPRRPDYSQGLRRSGVPLPVKEVGWSTVTITEEGRQDTVFQGVPREIPVLQWHEDTFDVPEGGRFWRRQKTVLTRLSARAAPSDCSFTLRWTAASWRIGSKIHP